MKKAYSFIWYPLTSYYEIENDEIEFKISKNISPYLELNDENFNDLLKKNIIEINPYYRFNEEFFKLTNEEMYGEKGKILDLFYDISFHVFGEIDLYIGQNKKDICVKEIIKGIEKGDLGECLKNGISLFKPYERHMIGATIYEMYRSLDVIEAFKEVIKLLYPDSIIYDKTSSRQNIILYLNYSKEKNKEKIEVLKKLFLPLGLEVDIFWEKHFGVVEVPITMKIGEIAIY